MLVLEAGRYEVERPSSSGIWCLLERWERDAVAPICYDRVGSASTLEAVRFLEARRAEGAADATIHAEIDAGYDEGRSPLLKVGASRTCSPPSGPPRRT